MVVLVVAVVIIVGGTGVFAYSFDTSLSYNALVLFFSAVRNAN